MTAADHSSSIFHVPHWIGFSIALFDLLDDRPKATGTQVWPACEAAGPFAVVLELHHSHLETRWLKTYISDTHQSEGI